MPNVPLLTPSLRFRIETRPTPLLFRLFDCWFAACRCDSNNAKHAIHYLILVCTTDQFNMHRLKLMKTLTLNSKVALPLYVSQSWQLHCYDHGDTEHNRFHHPCPSGISPTAGVYHHRLALHWHHEDI